MENLEIVDTPTPGREQALCRVNDSIVEIGVAEKAHEWHVHDTEDKFFYVVEGRFRIDLQDRTVELAPKQGFTVPKGVMHRTFSVVEPTLMLKVGLT
jgi:mannose-6-phosphate isomerase-like protein (cupin superfamily)